MIVSVVKLLNMEFCEAAFSQKYILKNMPVGKTIHCERAKAANTV